MIIQETNECAITDCHRRIYWGPIFVGALVGIGLAFLFNLFSVALGLSILKVQDGAVHMAVGGIIGIVIGVIVSMFLTGAVAGYLAHDNQHKCCMGILYGFAAWCLTLIIAVLIAMPLAHYVGSFSHFIAKPGYVVTNTEVGKNQQMPQDVVITNEDTNKIMNKKEMVVFLVFLLGALASSLGGYYGVHYCCKMRCEKDKIV